MRKLEGFWKNLVIVLSFALIIFQLYTAGFGAFPDMIQRAIHLFFVLLLCYIYKPAKKGAEESKVPVIDVFFMVIAGAATLYVLMIYDEIIWDPLQWVSPLDKFFAIALTFLILEASRRAVGLTFPIMGILLLIYAYFGEYFPGMWGHQQFSIDYIFQTLYHTTNGLWGTMVGISAVMLAMFGIFGSVLSATGGAQTFIRIAQNLTGKSVGGQGKVALISSGLFGMISGSAMANVVATGTFTIPLMKKSGYSNEWAGSISAVGSTGGQIMPPMMGAGAFVMSQLIGAPYSEIAVAAILPALLYYFSALVSIHYYSKKNNIAGSGEKFDVPRSEYAVIFIPIAIFIGFLVASYTVTLAAFYASISAVIVSLMVFYLDSKSFSGSVKNTGKQGYKITMESGKSILSMSGLLAGSQVSITLISMTGLGVKLSDLIVSVGQGNLFLSLILSMIVCIILGMGLPTTAAYVLAAAILAPPLITLGLEPLYAHLFVFYFSCLATITPPVCAAVFLSSGIAESEWVKTGILSVIIAIPAFIVPYTFVYNPALLLIGSIFEIFTSVLTAIIGVFFIGVAIAGFFKNPIYRAWRAIFFVGGVLLVIPDIMISLIGLVVCLVATFYNYKLTKVKEVL